MRNPTDEEIAGRLVGIISDGFNRSLRALEEAGAIKKTTVMRNSYKGVGSKLYDLVTEQIAYTARNAAQEMRQLFEDNASPVPLNESLVNNS